MTRSLQGFLEEVLGRSRVSLSGKPEVDRGAGGIDGTIQVPPAPTLANVGFIDPPRAVGWLQFPPTSLVQLGCVALHPAPNGGVVNRQTPFDEQLLDVPIRKREPQIPTDRANNDLGFEVPPFKQGWPRFGHRLAAYQTRAPASCNTSVQRVIAKRLGKEVSMEDRNDIHYEDDALDRELNALVREIEQEEVIRRTVIEMLVMLGSDAMLEHDV